MHVTFTAEKKATDKNHCLKIFDIEKIVLSQRIPVAYNQN